MTTTTESKTRSQLVADDVAALLRARNPLLWVVTREEGRVERYLFGAAGSAGYLARTWDIAQGFAAMDGSAIVPMLAPAGDPDGALDAIRDQKGTEDKPARGAWIMRDLPVWLNGPASAITLRRLRNLARYLPGQPRWSAQAVIVLSPTAEVPPELAGHATVVEWPLPDRTEIGAILDATLETLPDEVREGAASNGTRDAAIDAAIGLTEVEAQATFSRSLVQSRRVEPAAVAQEKKRVVAREGVLEWFDPLPGGLDAVGGLDNLKAWLVSRASAYSPAARAYGLPAPKGALLVGVPGCGKSLTAKAIATAWGVPLLRLDLGALKSKYVGESETNLRKAFAVIEAIGRCVVWLDEIEKALAGATGEQGDGGVSSDALGAILSWMQDRSGEAFVLATANNAESLPPELLRKGRFDEMWWVDMPTRDERALVLAAALRSHGRNAAEVMADGGLGTFLDATDTFTGAEIAALVPDAMFTAFGEGARELTTGDLVSAAKDVVPLARTAEAKIKALREFWAGRARPATSPAPQKSAYEESLKARTTKGRQLDID